MKIVEQADDQDLLLLIANGSEQAFRQLFDLYKNKVYSHAMHLTQSVAVAEEITQDVFLTCWLKRATLPEINNFSAWLCTLTKNACFNQLKKIAREYQCKNAMAQTGEPAEEQIESYLAVKEQQQLLQQAMEQLSTKQRLVFSMNREGGMKNAEIAEQLKISPNTVKTHMVSAIRTIRLFFKAHAEQALQLLAVLHFLR